MRLGQEEFTWEVGRLHVGLWPLTEMAMLAKEFERKSAWGQVRYQQLHKKQLGNKLVHCSGLCLDESES